MVLLRPKALWAFALTLSLIFFPLRGWGVDEGLFKEELVRLLDQGYEFSIPPHDLFCESWNSSQNKQSLEDRSFPNSEAYEKALWEFKSEVLEEVVERQKKGCTLWVHYTGKDKVKNKDKTLHRFRFYPWVGEEEREERLWRKWGEWFFSLENHFTYHQFSQKMTYEATGPTLNEIESRSFPFPNLRLEVGFRFRKKHYFQLLENFSRSDFKIYRNRNEEILKTVTKNSFHLDLSYLRQLEQKKYFVGGGISLRQDSFFYSPDGFNLNAVTLSVWAPQVVAVLMKKSPFTGGRWEIWGRYLYGLKVLGPNSIKVKKFHFHEFSFSPFLRWPMQGGEWDLLLGGLAKLVYFRSTVEAGTVGAQKISRWDRVIGLTAGISF